LHECSKTRYPERIVEKHMHNKANNPIISDEFLEQVVKEINLQFGGTINEKNDRFQHGGDDERK
ncbi:hypothetical protein ABWK46_01730, partial [Peribacillus frigoritolerans]|uniref:hypothetical protein n=1 Tax=Peribacillus frigoritolerans TaxID=450367 RepID=UPI003398A705